jgi:hypothetical protein
MTRVRRTHTFGSVLGVAMCLLVAAMVAALVGSGSASAAGHAKPVKGGGATTLTATHIGVVISNPDITLPATPGSLGLVYVVQDAPFQATLSFLDDSGVQAPISTTKDTTVTLRSGGCSGAILASTVVPAGVKDDQTVAGLTLTARNTTTVCASAPGAKPHTVVSGTSAAFDVLKQVVHTPADQTLTSIGGDTSVTGCDATVASPVCADLLLPSTTANNDDAGIFMSLGLCDGLSKCSGSLVQALVGLDPTVYTRANPATIVMRCDKTLCGTGSIKKQKLYAALAPTDTPTEAPACPAKGTVGADQTFCVDYVQSTRSNSGDTWLYLLFIQDLRIHFL